MLDRIEHPNPLDAEEATVRSAARGARADRDRLALQLSREPDNKAAAADLVALELELDGYRRSLERIAGARRALAAAAAADTRSARQARLDDHRAAAQAATAAITAAATQAETIIASFGPVLAEIDQHGAALQAQATAAGRIVDRARLLQFASPAQQHATSHIAPLLHALADAVRGTQLERYVQIGGLHGRSAGVEHLLGQSGERMTAALAGWVLPDPQPVLVDEEACHE